MASVQLLAWSRPPELSPPRRGHGSPPLSCWTPPAFFSVSTESFPSSAPLPGADPLPLSEHSVLRQQPLRLSLRTGHGTVQRKREATWTCVRILALPFVRSVISVSSSVRNNICLSGVSLGHERDLMHMTELNTELAPLNVGCFCHQMGCGPAGPWRNRCLQDDHIGAICSN